MSSKHLRRLLEEKERQQEHKVEVEEEEGKEESEEEPAPLKAVPNKFALFDDNGSESEPEHADSDDEPPLPAETKTSKKRKNKNKKKKKKDVEEEEDLDAIPCGSLAAVTLDEIQDISKFFKFDVRLIDPTAELKRALGKAFKEESSSSNRPRNSRWRPAGRIVKQKPTWPPIRNVGLSMKMVSDRDDNLKYFKFEHNSYYEKLEKMCWLAEDTHDINLVQDVLHDNYYHLNSLMMLANVMTMQEDYTQAMDCLERGIFYAEQSFHPLFEITTWNHRLDYLDYENRAFYLLLHKYMQLCMRKRCFETAMEVAKLIFSLDSIGDPLATLLIIDTIALRARQYEWVIDFVRAAQGWKNLHMLPNVLYSRALAKFLSAKGQSEEIDADEKLIEAITTFPAFIWQLLEELGVQADSAVEYHRHMSHFALAKDPEGLQLIYKIYCKQTSELWKAPETLSWLERICRLVATTKEYEAEMDKRKEKNQKVFSGIPQNLKRLAILLGMRETKSPLDPSPPQNGRQRYQREHFNRTAVADESFLAGFLHSLMPNFNPEESLQQYLQRLQNELLPAAQENGNPADQPPNPENGEDDEEEQ